MTQAFETHPQVLLATNTLQASVFDPRLFSPIRLEGPNSSACNSAGGLFQPAAKAARKMIVMTKKSKRVRYRNPKSVAFWKAVARVDAALDHFCKTAPGLDMREIAIRLVPVNYEVRKIWSGLPICNRPASFRRAS